MKIRTRLTLLFTVVVSVLLLVFCVVIYGITERQRSLEFYQRLDAEATNEPMLIFGTETISPEVYKLLDKYHLTVLNDEEIIIYNFQDSLIYESGTDFLKVDKATLDRVRLEKEIRWREGQREIVGVYFADRYNRLVVFVSAIDKYGFQKVENLAWIMGIGWFIATLLVFLVGWVYAERALLPLKKLISKVDEVTASRLDLRVEVPQVQDEIGQLAQRFNRMLDRLEEAFITQKAFVSNASHELRTPLTAIRGQIQVALMDDDPEEWKQTLESVLEDTQNLTHLSNGLLTMASLNVEENSMALVPISLLMMFEEVRAELLKAHPSYTIKFFADPRTEHTVQGNDALLRIALLNLTENGCKYSPNHIVTVKLEKVYGFQQFMFHNEGPPIPADELPHIFKPFKRATNAARVAGHGIGLSLTERIVKLHRGRIVVSSTANEGTTFTLQLPTN